MNNQTFDQYTTRPSDPELFRIACDHAFKRVSGTNGIGTLSEKSVHAVLKYYYVPDENCHEIPIDRFVADVCKEGEIYEIQTRNFNTLRPKLACFLENYEVSVVYPIDFHKTIRWIDPVTGEIKENRKSSKKGHPYDVLLELYRIKQFLNYDNLHIILCLMETEEYRLLDGYDITKKKHSTKTDRMPTELVQEILIDQKKDYLCFLPDDLPDPFTTKDISKTSKRPLSQAQILCTLLQYLDLIEKTGTKDRYNLYHIR